MDFPNLPTPGAVDSLGLLFTLLPGLLTYVVVRALTARGEKIEPAEAILHGLAYTLVVHAIWFGLTALGSVIPTPDLIGLALTAVGLALGVAALHNSGRFYGLLRRWRLTNQPSWLTIWETAFREYRGVRKGEYAVLHLKDGRRVMGAIRGFSPRQEKGHVCMERVQWLSDETGVKNPEHAGLHLFNADDVFVVEFMPLRKGDSDAKGANDHSSARGTGPGQRSEDLVRPTEA
jgi:hypothetical protein